MPSIRQALKTTLGAALVAGAAGHYGYDRFFLRSKAAFVVAPAQWISVPQDGVVTHSLKVFSAEPKGSQLASVAAAVDNDTELRAVKAELLALRGDLEATKQLLEFGNEITATTRTREATLRHQQNLHLERLVHQAESKLATTQSVNEGAQKAWDKGAALCSEGLMPGLECDKLRVESEVSGRALTSAEGELSIAKFLLESSQRGVDVGQGIASEATYSRQQRDALALTLAQLRRELALKRARASALEYRVAVPDMSVTAEFPLRVLSVAKPSGTTVRRGEALLRVADCSRLFVIAGVDVEQYERLRVGMPAHLATAEEEYPAHVAELMGPATVQSFDAQFPGGVVNHAGEQAKILYSVAVKSSELVKRRGAACELGGAIEVSFGGDA